MNTEVHAAYTKLLTTMESLVKSYRVLLDQVRREKEHLIGVEIKELNELNQEKELLLNRIHQVENSRIRHAQELSALMNIEGQPPKLLDIAHKLPDEMSEKLRSIHATLELLLTRVMEINKTNSKLAQNVLRSTTGAIESIKQSLCGEVKPTYQRKGKIEKSEHLGGLVRKQL